MIEMYVLGKKKNKFNEKLFFVIESNTKIQNLKFIWNFKLLL